MRFAAIFAVAAFAAAVSAQDATPTVPQGVDQTKPEAVKSYYTSVVNDGKALESKLAPLVPSEKIEQVKTLVEANFKALEGQVATATESADLAKLATTIAAIDAQIKKAAANPESYAKSVVSQLDGLKSATSSKTNAAMSDVSVSAARLAVGAIAGAAAFAVLF
ncbi:hypothetical protein GQ42DRAFT_162638 [Ramicandelaber brevisporus]|nr:hypothetical protein GQ42DRAFT_162638 [Ramicandelaber brevisporus]